MSAARRSGEIAVSTIISRNYLSHARVLFRSYREHAPGARCYLLVVDGLPEGTELPAGIRLIDVGELGCRDIRARAFQYNVVELCTSLKASLFELLFAQYREQAVLFLDPDIFVLRRLVEAEAALSESSILLTPQLLDPLPGDGKTPTEENVMIGGVFNLGFLGLSDTPESRSFLTWWGERLEHDCREKPLEGLFVDQRWVDIVPSLFRSVAILQDETYNAASWNLATRNVAGERGRFLLNGKPLSFFHFSGFRVAERRFRTEWGDRLEVRPGTALADLCNVYAEYHQEEGYRESFAWEYGYFRFNDGVPIDGILRETYWRLDEETKTAFGDPFRAGGPQSFREWAVIPDRELQGLSPFLHTLYEIRADVRATFPDVNGAHRGAFFKWARESGAREMNYDPSLVRGTS